MGSSLQLTCRLFSKVNIVGGGDDRESIKADQTYLSLMDHEGCVSADEAFPCPSM